MKYTIADCEFVCNEETFKSCISMTFDYPAESFTKFLRAWRELRTDLLKKYSRSDLIIIGRKIYFKHTEDALAFFLTL